MKEKTFTVLFILESIVVLILMGMLLANLGIFAYPVAIGILALQLCRIFRKLKTMEDEEEKAKLRRKILLIMLIPAAVAIVAVIAVVVSLLLYFE